MVTIYIVYSKQMLDLPEIPGRPAARHVHIKQLRVHGPDGHLQPLLLLIPKNLETHLHVDLAPVGDGLAAAARDLHAAEEAKVDPLPDPGPGVHRHVQPGRDVHRVVLVKADPEAVPLQIDVMPPS